VFTLAIVPPSHFSIGAWSFFAREEFALSQLDRDDQIIFQAVVMLDARRAFS